MKQVIVIRKDLNMRKGKMIAQGAHASMVAILNQKVHNEYDLPTLTIPMTPEMETWLSGKFTKIVVYVNSEEELTDLYCKAKEASILASIIRDEGLTEFKGIPTYTAVAIGPANSEAIDKITGDLKLL
jgi:PTH2 family peptidyl-tRNA hydrolase